MCGILGDGGACRNSTDQGFENVQIRKIFQGMKGFLYLSYKVESIGKK